MPSNKREVSFFFSICILENCTASLHCVMNVSPAERAGSETLEPVEEYAADIIVGDGRFLGAGRHAQRPQEVVDQDVELLHIFGLRVHHAEHHLVPLPHALGVWGADVVLDDGLPLPPADPASQEALDLRVQKHAVRPNRRLRGTRSNPKLVVTFLIFLISESSSDGAAAGLAWIFSLSLSKPAICWRGSHESWSWQLHNWQHECFLFPSRRSFESGLFFCPKRLHLLYCGANRRRVWWTECKRCSCMFAA